jgi:hypothetical protein
MAAGPLSLILQQTISQPVCLGINHLSGAYDQIFFYCQTVAGLLMWGTLSDERAGLPFTIAAGPRQRIFGSKSHGTRDHILLSQIRTRLHTESLLVFVIYTHIHHRRGPRCEHRFQQFFYCCVSACCGHCLATGTSAEPFPTNRCLCWFHNSGFQQTCHSIFDVKRRILYTGDFLIDYLCVLFMGDGSNGRS